MDGTTITAVCAVSIALAATGIRLPRTMERQPRQI
jgi:hypothetical protein